MTLTTDLLICEPVNPERVFKYAMSLLAQNVASEPRWDHTDAGEGRGYGDAHYVTECGQGLPAWLWVHYLPDGPLVWYDDERLGWELEDDPAFMPPWWNQHCVRVNVDTGYSYRGPGGGGCDDLHAWFLTEMAAWLANQGIAKWVWKTDIIGDWNEGLAGVTEFGDPVAGSLLVRSSSGEHAPAGATGSADPAGAPSGEDER